MSEIFKALTIEQVAESFGVEPRVVRAWIKSGELAAFDVGIKRGSVKPRFRITPEAVEVFIRIRSTAPTPRQPPRKVLPPVKNFV